MLESHTQQMIQEILDYRCPRYEQLPDISLYSDQIIDALDRYATPLLTDGSEHVITPSMINNYVKQRLIPPPEKKRYDRDHLAHRARADSQHRELHWKFGHLCRQFGGNL